MRGSKLLSRFDIDDGTFSADVLSGWQFGYGQLPNSSRPIETKPDSKYSSVVGQFVTSCI